MSENQKNPSNQGMGSNKEQTGKNNPGDGRDQKNQQQPMKPGDQAKRESSAGPNDPNDPNSPERKIEIDDNPSETEKKIPHMKK